MLRASPRLVTAVTPYLRKLLGALLLNNTDQWTGQHPESGNLVD